VCAGVGVGVNLCVGGSGRGEKGDREREGEIVSKHIFSVSFVASIQNKTSFGLLKISTPKLRMKNKLSFVVRFFLDQSDNIKRLLYTLFSWFFYLFSLTLFLLISLLHGLLSISLFLFFLSHHLIYV
jgi:hypothetical protein